jgi:hypothetical protein
MGLIVAVIGVALAFLSYMRWLVRRVDLLNRPSRPDAPAEPIRPR